MKNLLLIIAITFASLSSSAQVDPNNPTGLNGIFNSYNVCSYDYKNLHPMIDGSISWNANFTFRTYDNGVFSSPLNAGNLLIGNDSVEVYQYYTLTDNFGVVVQTWEFIIAPTIINEIYISADWDEDYYVIQMSPGNTDTMWRYDFVGGVDVYCKQWNVMSPSGVSCMGYKDKYYITFDEPTQQTNTITECDTYYHTETDSTYSQSTVIVDSLISETNELTIVTTNLTIETSTTVLHTNFACDAFDMGFMLVYSDTSFTYNTAAPDGATCPTIHTVEITVNYTDTLTTDVHTCSNYFWHGTTYSSLVDTTIVSYYYTTTVAGCDSVEVLNLTFHIPTTPSLTSIYDATSSSFELSIIGGSNTTSTYTWYDCNTDEELGYDSVYYATDNSLYYVVETTEFGCDNTSGCITIDELGFNTTSKLENITLYPNPTSGNVNINLGGIDATVTVYDVSGKVVYLDSVSSNTSFNLDGDSGIYIVSVESDGSTKQFKLIKR